jgi:type II secretory ATPase GspE/PulE/Tfp pilus assembly ATPase PilB-like protein
MVQFQEDKQRVRLEGLRKREAENLTVALASKYKLPYIDLKITPINIEALRSIKEEEAREAKVGPFNLINKKVQIGILTPNNPKTLELTEGLKNKGLQPELFMVSQESLDRVWQRYPELSSATKTRGGALDISNEEIVEFIKRASGLNELKELVEENLVGKRVHQVSRILEIILAGALANQASDVHWEAEEDYVRLRYRLDGVLTDITNIDFHTYRLLISRVKLLSRLKLNVNKKAQDGRFSVKVGDADIEVRTSIIPGAYGESIVLRVLDPKTIAVPLEQLGINPRLLDIIIYEISKPNGLILTTGPTGSGKTTTLYAFLKKVYSPGIKIITIENPIEYHLPGIVQTQTDAEKGYTFLEGLRSSLRQDPDVIMVGEIRDSETAEIAINAALTGHLVFSTLHTNNAAGSFPRLIDLGVNSKVITSATNIAIAQRLLRKLCDYCKKEVILKEEKQQLVEKILQSVEDTAYLNNLQTKVAWEASGCKKCNLSGFKGRTGIFEAIRTNEEIERVVQQNPSEREIWRAAAGQNILNMRQDGIIKVLQGITSIEELQRVVDLAQD